MKKGFVITLVALGAVLLLGALNTVSSVLIINSQVATSTINSSPIGNTTPSTGVFTAITGPLTGNASTATALASSPSQCAGGNVATGIAANGNANCTPVFTGVIKVLATGATCTTGSSSYDSCTSTYSWGSSFADSAYALTITGLGNSNACVASLSSFNASQFVVQVQTMRGASCNFSQIQAIGVHP